MNIFFLLQDTGRVYGAERATLDLAAGVKAAGHNPRFLLMEETRLNLAASDLRTAIAGIGLELTSIRVDSRFSFSVVNAIHEKLVEYGAHLLHCVGYKADVHGGMATRWGQEWPVVSTVHGWLFRRDFKELFYGWINLHALRRCTRVISLSRHYEQMLLEEGIARDRLVRIPSGLDMDSLQTSPMPGGEFTVGIMGRLSAEKNHAMFLKAARAVLDAGVPARFVIAGDGPELARVQAQVSALNLQDQVALAGFISREKFLEQVHVVALCSTIENLPYTVMESMAWSRPVVATKVGGLPDLVEDGLTGFLVPPDDAAELAARLIRLANDRALCAKLGEMGRYKVEAEFSREQMVGRTLEVYTSLL